MKLHPLVLALGLIPLVGCGGGDGGNTTSTYSITTIDGYLKNAQVWLDLDGDFLLDNNEPSALSGENGVADLDVTDIINPEQYPVVVQAIAGKTIDIGDDVQNPANNAPIDISYMMSAPAGETDITPLSTLVHVILEQYIASANRELSDAEIKLIKTKAVAQVAKLLGIPNDKVLGDFIKEENNEIAFAAENLVAAHILPKTPEEMRLVVEAAKLDDSDDTETTSTFLANVEAATVMIKTIIKIVVKAADPEEPIDFSGINPVFPESNDTTDSDEDGVPDYLDAFPSLASEWVDTDGDMVGNNADAFPFDAGETTDTDKDGIGDNADPHNDNVGTWDTSRWDSNAKFQ